jgi:hypothetical protein
LDQSSVQAFSKAGEVFRSLVLELWRATDVKQSYIAGWPKGLDRKNVASVLRARIM